MRIQRNILNRLSCLKKAFTLLLALYVISAVYTQEALPPPANTVCPVMEGEEVSPGIYIDYKGKRVYFCCTYCQTQFKKNPEKFTSKLPAFNSNDVNIAQPADDLSSAPKAMTPQQVLEADTREHLPLFLQFLGKLHPVVVHFPIALIIATLLAEILAGAASSWETTCRAAARFMLPVGAFGTIPAVMFGWFAADGAGQVGDVSQMIYRHRWLGVITLGVSILTAILQHFSRKYDMPVYAWAYRFLLLLAAVLVGITGHLGGLLVYGADRF